MKLFVLVIDNEYGISTYLHRTEKGAKKDLLEYVKEWWSHEFENDEVMPTDPDEAIDAYFNSEKILGRESYSLTEKEVDD